MLPTCSFAPDVTKSLARSLLYLDEDFPEAYPVSFILPLIFLNVDYLLSTEAVSAANDLVSASISTLTMESEACRSFDAFLETLSVEGILSTMALAGGAVFFLSFFEGLVSPSGAGATSYSTAAYGVSSFSTSASTAFITFSTTASLTLDSFFLSGDLATLFLLSTFFMVLLGESFFWALAGGNFFVIYFLMTGFFSLSVSLSSLDSICFLCLPVFLARPTE